jgi:hypothetical protein
MNFRFKAFGLHVTASTCLFALALGTLYFGWYRWPGWYLTGATTIVLMMAGIDVVLGPLLTFVVASPNKPRRVLARDIAIIVTVQLAAMGYGLTTLWHGRPLYYTFSTRFLGRKLNPEFAPYWYSLPRWVYAPLPKDDKLVERIVQNSISGGDDVIQMPRYFQPWQQGTAELRKTLRPVAKMTEISVKAKQVAGEQMRELGVTVDQPVALPMLGRKNPIVGVIDPATGRIRALLRAD